MVQEKLSYTYLMNRYKSGNLEKMIKLLPEEIYDTALKMLGEILLASSIEGSQKDKWQNLYKLVPEDQATSYFKQVCRQFIKSLNPEYEGA